ncbi:MAG: hypothetical protein ACRD4T_00165 [Candidatus Acidiferrales bacterium]
MPLFDELEGEVEETQAQSFEALEGDAFDVRDEQLKSIFDATLNREPTRQAKVLSLAGRTGVATDLVEARLDDFDRTWQASQFDSKKWREQNPELAQIVLESPALAPVVMRDQKLSAFSELLNRTVDAREWLGERLGLDKVTDALGFNPLDPTFVADLPERIAETATAIATGKPPPTAKERREAERTRPTAGALVETEKTRRFEQFKELFGPAAAVIVPVERFRESRAQLEIAKLQLDLMRMRAFNEVNEERATQGAPPLEAPFNLGGDTYELEKRILDAKRAAAPTYFGEGEFQTLTEVVQSMASQVAVLEQGGKGAALGAAGGALVGAAATKSPAGAVRGAAKGASVFGQLGVAYGALQLESGSLYGELLQAKTDDGKPLTEQEARGGALLYGAMAAGVEVASMRLALKALGPLGKTFLAGESRAAVMDLLARDAGFRQIAARAGREWAKATVGEAGEEFSQSILKDAVSYVARSKAAGAPQAGPVADIGKAKGEAGRALIGSGLGFGALSLGVNALTHTLARDRAHIAGQQVAAIAGLGDTDSVRAAPEAVARMISEKTAATGKPVTHLYVDPQAFTRLFQSEVPKAADALLGEDGPALLQEAVATGSKLEVPLPLYLEKWGPTEAAKQLAEDTTTAPDLDTPRQLAEAAKVDEAEVEAIVEQYQKEISDDPGATVDEKGFVEDLAQRLQATGQYDAQAARAAVAPIAAVARTAARRFKLDPAQLFRGLRIQIRGPETAAVEDGTFDFGSNVAPSPLRADAEAFVERMRDAEKRAMAKAWLHYVDGELTERPHISDELERDLARYGVVDPAGFTFDESGRTMERILGGRRRTQEEPEALRAYRIEAMNFKRGVYLYQPPKDEPQTSAVAPRQVIERLRADFRAADKPEQARRYNTDDVTGLLNQRGWAAAKAEGPVAAVRAGAIKAVNDRFSHQDADAYLEEVARIVEKYNPQAGRVGGNFLVPLEAERVKDLRAELAAAPALQGMPIAVGHGPDVAAATKSLNDAIEERKKATDATRWPARAELPAALQGRKSVPFAPGKAAATLGEAHQVGAGEAELTAAVDTVYVEPGTGALTKAGFERLQEMEPKRHVMAMDLNGLREIHLRLEQAFGLTPEQAHEFGDKIIGAFTRKAMEIGGEAFDFARFGGDEYMARSDDPQALVAFGRQLEKAAARMYVVAAGKATGAVYVYEGIGFGRGIGTDRKFADRALNRHKARLEREGRRGGEAERVKRFASTRGAEGSGYRLQGRGAGLDTGAGPLESKEVTHLESGPAPGKKGPRGAATFTRDAVGRLVEIALSKDADFSTFLHESGHLFFEMLGDLAERADAPEQVKQDWATSLNWVGVKDRAELAARSAEAGGIRDAAEAEGRELTAAEKARVDELVEPFEKWARGFERYLFEGKAPSEKLAGPFERFKLWLKQVYRTFASLGVDLNDDIRGVFDRLLATDAEIARTKRRMALQPMFRGPEEAGMSPEEWQEYLDAQEQATAHAVRRAEFAALKDRLRANERWWKDEERKLRQDAEAEYPELPAARAKAALKGVVLDRAIVQAAVGAEAAKTFRTAKNGANPDELADLFGYPTAAELLRAVAALPDRKSWAKAEARSRMEARHPDILEEQGRLRVEAEKGLHGDLTEKWLLKEWAALRARGPKTGPRRPPPVEAIKRAAAHIVDRRPVKRLDASVALAAERAAAEKAAIAAAKGDFAQAAVHKQQQLLNLYLHRELSKARERRTAFLEMAAELAKDKARARLGKARAAYRGGVDLVLETLGLKEPSRREEPLPSLAEVVATMVQDGSSIPFDEEVVGRVLARAARSTGDAPWVELSVAELREVDAFLRSVKAAATLRNTAILDDRRVDREQLVTDLVAEAQASLESRGAAVEQSAQTTGERLASWWNGVIGSQLKPEVQVNRLGGGSLKSVWFRVFVKPLQRAKAREVDLLKKAIKPILDAFDKMPRAQAQDRIDGARLFPDHRPDLAPPRRRYELLLLALNAGNEGNLSRLLEGRNITEPQLRAALDLLTKEELDWVQAVWDAAESLWPESAALEERETGLRPPKVEARSLVTRHGTYRGGYFPAVYVRDVEAVGEKQEASALAALLDPSYTRPGTSHGHLKRRVAGFTGALSLEPSTIGRHLAQAAHDIAFREAVKSVGSLVFDERVRAVLRDRLGPEQAGQFLPWLKDVGQMRGAEGFERAGNMLRALRWLKTNTVIAALGYSIPNALEDLTNLPAAVARTDLKAQHLAAAIGEFLGAPRETLALTEAKSGELRARRDQLQRELTRQVRNLTAARVLKPARWVKDHAFAFMEFTDKYTSTPVWLAGYRQALARGEAEGEAVTYADALVRKVFPSHSPVDAAPVLRDKSAVGMLLAFHGWLSTHFNSMAELVYAFGRADTARDRARVAGQMLAYVAVVGPLAALVRGHGREEDEEWASWFLRKMLASPVSGFVGGGDVANLVEARVMGKRANQRTLSIIGAGAVFFEAALNLAGEDADAKDLLRFVRSLGPLTGLPLAQPLRAARYAADVSAGEIEPEGAGDVARGVIYGRQ